MRWGLARCGAVLVGLLLTSCATTQSRYVLLGHTYPSRPDNCEIAVLRTGYPAREFVRVSRVDVHLEKTHFIGSGFEDAWPMLRQQACLSGADAIIDIRENASVYMETRMYHVTATGIKFKE